MGGYRYDNRRLLSHNFPPPFRLARDMPAANRSMILRRVLLNLSRTIHPKFTSYPRTPPPVHCCSPTGKSKKKTVKMAKKAFVLVADGSEEIEFVTVYDVLVRAGFLVCSIGVNISDSFARLSRGVKIVPDVQSLDPEAQLPDLIVLPGGAPGAKTFEESDAVARLIDRARKEGVYIGAICAATKALVIFGAEGGWKARVTSHPSVQEAVVKAGWEYAQDRVVLDGKVITSRGPGTSLLFALTLVETLCGRERREEVEAPMITASEL